MALLINLAGALYMLINSSPAAVETWPGCGCWHHRITCPEAGQIEGQQPQEQRHLSREGGSCSTGRSEWRKTMHKLAFLKHKSNYSLLPADTVQLMWSRSGFCSPHNKEDAPSWQHFPILELNERDTNRFLKGLFLRATNDTKLEPTTDLIVFYSHITFSLNELMETCII